MLDKRMTYTCARWKKGLTTLDEAQECKFELICRKLKLKKGDHILDIGCGWGSFAKYTAQHHGVRVTGITISKEQIVLARELCQGLPIEIRYMDYRDPLLRQEKFDHIISIGMFEHVGPKNYAQYMGIAYQCLKPGGLFLLHTIVGNKTSRSNDPWINKYIFPDSMLPSMKQIASAVEDTGFVTEDVENFGPDYAKTLGAWYDNFVASWSELVAIDPGKYTEEFFRMWTYYLLACKGLFESRSAQLHQYVLSKEVPHYDSVR
jgi:cyclopropane-fatty-acyl-phospholipid synthase